MIKCQFCGPKLHSKSIFETFLKPQILNNKFFNINNFLIKNMLLNCIRNRSSSSSAYENFFCERRSSSPLFPILSMPLNEECCGMCFSKTYRGFKFEIQPLKSKFLW